MEWLPPGWCPRVVAFDIDGTLTDENKRLNMHAVEALRRLEDAGIPVILATGNVRAITYGLWRFIGLSGPMRCEMEVRGIQTGMSLWFGPQVRKQGMLQDGLNPNILNDSNGIQTNAERASGVYSPMISNWYLFNSTK